MNRLVVFDCDGTLIDSQANICRAMDTAFGRAAIALPSHDAVRRVVGLSVIEAIAALLPDADTDLHRRIAGDYKLAFQQLRADGHVDEPLFDGIAELLGALVDGGWRLGVATGKSGRGLALALAQHGITERFVTLQTADHHPSKPHPSMVEAAMAEAGAAPATTVVIGDTSFDMAMAMNAGVHAIGVAWGYHPAEELIAAGAACVAAHPAELIDMLERP